MAPTFYQRYRSTVWTLIVIAVFLAIVNLPQSFFFEGDSPESQVVRRQKECSWAVKSSIRMVSKCEDFAQSLKMYERNLISPIAVDAWFQVAEYNLVQNKVDGAKVACGSSISYWEMVPADGRLQSKKALALKTCNALFATHGK